VSLHVLRHSTAMELLHHGVDQSVIALWLGHESIEKRRSICVLICVRRDVRVAPLQRPQPSALNCSDQTIFIFRSRDGECALSRQDSGSGSTRNQPGASTITAAIPADSAPGPDYLW
jgi:Phage integrase family